jgi:hypothetical protein
LVLPFKGFACDAVSERILWHLPETGGVIGVDYPIFVMLYGTTHFDSRIVKLRDKNNQDLEIDVNVRNQMRLFGRKLEIKPQQLTPGFYEITVYHKRNTDSPELTTAGSFSFQVDTYVKSIKKPETPTFSWKLGSEYSTCWLGPTAIIEIEVDDDPPHYYEIISETVSNGEKIQLLPARKAEKGKIRETLYVETECLNVTGVMADGTRGPTKKICEPLTTKDGN